MTGYRGVWLTVTDISRSVAFYTGLFDVTARAVSDGTTVLMVGRDGSYLALTRGAEPGISRFSLAVARFDPDEVMLALATAGVSGRRVTSRDTLPAIEFTDPDGTTVLLER